MQCMRMGATEGTARHLAVGCARLPGAKALGTAHLHARSPRPAQDNKNRAVQAGRPAAHRDARVWLAIEISRVDEKQGVEKPAARAAQDRLFMSHLGTGQQWALLAAVRRGRLGRTATVAGTPARRGTPMSDALTSAPEAGQRSQRGSAWVPATGQGEQGRRWMACREGCGREAFKERWTSTNTVLLGRLQTKAGRRLGQRSPAGLPASCPWLSERVPGAAQALASLLHKLHSHRKSMGLQARKADRMGGHKETLAVGLSVREHKSACSPQGLFVSTTAVDACQASGCRQFEPPLGSLVEYAMDADFPQHAAVRCSANWRDQARL